MLELLSSTLKVMRSLLSLSFHHLPVTLNASLHEFRALQVERPTAWQKLKRFLLGRNSLVRLVL